MSVYDDSAATALEMISEYGDEYTFTNVLRGEYDTSLRGTINDVTTNYAAKAVVTRFSKSFLANAATEQGDIALLAVVGPYKINDTVVISGRTYRILIADPLKPGDIVLLYKLQLRA